MDEESRTNGGYSKSDKLAIALACLAGVMAIILFLVEKTPLSVMGLLTLMVGLCGYPILHFMKSTNVRVGLGVFVLVGTLAFGWGEWPKSKIIETQSQSVQQTASERPQEPPKTEIPPAKPIPKATPLKRAEAAVSQEKNKKSEPIVQESKGSQNNTNTQIGSTQGPIAIAPNGIANAAPNLGTQTVNNFAPPARTIPPEKRIECISLLSSVHGSVSVNALSGDPEAFRYAKEWYSLFVASGWNMKDSQVMSIVFFSAPPQGIQVNFHGESLTPDQAIVPSPPFLLPLEKCLNELGIERRGNPHPEMPDHEILFIVGMKPD